jgi:hypothetical protein
MPDSATPSRISAPTNTTSETTPATSATTRTTLVTVPKTTPDSRYAKDRQGQLEPSTFSGFWPSACQAVRCRTFRL